MRPLLRQTLFSLSLLALSAVAQPAFGQFGPNCPYDQCALRVAYNAAGSALVRGRDQIVINGLGFWALKPCDVATLSRSSPLWIRSCASSLFARAS